MHCFTFNGLSWPSRCPLMALQWALMVFMPRTCHCHGLSRRPWHCHGSTWHCMGLKCLHELSRAFMALSCTPIGLFHDISTGFHGIGCHGNAISVPWQYHCRSMAIPWVSHATPMAPWVSLTPPWYYPGIVIAVHGSAMAVSQRPMKAHCIVMAVPWQYHGRHRKILKAHGAVPWQGLGDLENPC